MSDSSMGVSEGAAITGAARMRTARKVGFYTIVIREFSRIIRIWGQTIVPPVNHGDAVLHHLRQPDRPAHRRHERLLVHAVHRAGPDHDGRDHNSYGNVVSSFFGAKFGRHIEELLVSPLPSWLIVLGYVTGGVLRGLLVGLVVTLVSLFFTHLHVEHLFVVIAAVTADVGRVRARRFRQRGLRQELRPDHVRADLHPDADDIPRRRVLSISMLPEWAQQMSKVNPILYMVNAFRFGFLGHSRRQHRLLVRDHDRRRRGDVRRPASGC
jgi:ABC-2 type transport system permease protein